MARARRKPARTLKIEGISVVLLGSFNPQIFQPAWMARQDLLSQEEVDAAEIGIIHSDVVSFRAGWLGLDLTHERFQAETTDATSYEALRDLVNGVFAKLPHTPIYAMGLNKNAHYQMASEASWHRLGHTLVPKGPWEPVLEKPGTRSVTIEGVRPDRRVGFIRITFEPSVRVTPRGVYLAVNDHYQLGTPDRMSTGAEAMDVLGEVWDESFARADHAMDHLSGLA